MTEYWPTFAELRRVARERFTSTVVATAGGFAVFASSISAVVLVLVFPHLELPVPSILFYVTWALMTAAAFFFMLGRLAFPRGHTP